MDPVDYAAAYDRRFRSALGQRTHEGRLKQLVLEKCLKLEREELSETEMKCLQVESKVLAKYLL